LAHAALCAVRILCGPEGDERRAHLWRLVERLAAGLRALGLAAEARSPIFPVVLGAPERALSAAAALRARGFLIKAIRPPTVPASTSRLRITLTAAHEEGQIDALLGALAEVL
jgi:8-amino-7-oxononanoate synthase